MIYLRNAKRPPNKPYCTVFYRLSLHILDVGSRGPKGPYRPDWPPGWLKGVLGDVGDRGSVGVHALGDADLVSGA